MIKFLKRLLGRDKQNEQILEDKRIEAHDIKNHMTRDILKIKQKVDRINKNTYYKLQEVSADLESVTYQIAVAQGGKKRGLK